MNRKYLDIFIREANEHISSLQNGLLVLEKSPGSPDLLQELLRNAHTIKGSAKMVGLDDIGTIAHRMEDFLKEVVELTRNVDQGLIDRLLRGTDAIASLTRTLAAGEEPAFNVAAFMPTLEEGSSPVPAEPVAIEEVAFGDTVRTKVKTLDTLVNLIGELIFIRNRFDERLGRFKGILIETGSPHPGMKLLSREMEDDGMYLHQLVQELQVQTMALRMLPLGSITEGFRRMVRDIAREQGKEADLVVTGESIELDRVLLENLKPMLLHMLRNSIDHGLESAEERELSGKPSSGTISINARYDGGSVRIDIRDDGRGIDPHKVRQAAIQKGLAEKDEVELLQDEEALYLILRPGFSTTTFVTELSGRGIGMDVVKKNIEQIKGNLTIRSEVGRFSEFTLHLPLTLSVIDALLLETQGEYFAIPLNYVQETLKVRATEISSVSGQEVITIRGATVPLISLPQLLGLPQNNSFLTEPTIAAVVLKFREQLIACSVGRTIGSSEIVVKGLGGQLKKVPFVSGATILGTGDPALILNVPDIFAHSERGKGTSIREALLSSGEAKSKGRILVVDDSITTRTMERTILLTHGYQVELAVSGEDALEVVNRFQLPFDLVISDVEMPGINGFELCRRLRAMPSYAPIPIMIVSSLARDEDKRQAMEAGAQAYIVKGNFEQGMLLDTVEALIG
jgi:two-component system chemotaxis sensor kinase CheA